MLWELIKKLSDLPGVSGCEEQVRYEILRQIEGHCIYRVDALGNILAFKKGTAGPGKTILFSAHMDEVGLILTYVEDSGLLRFSTVGGIDRRVLTGKAVFIQSTSKGGAVPGVIGTKAMHQKTTAEREKALDVKDLFIDIGAKDRAEAEALVALGDRAIFSSHYTDFGDGFVRGRALDDRIGCSLLIQLIQSDIKYDTHFSFTVQEETGTTGGKTAAAQILPDVAVAVEATTACDIPGTTDEKVVCALRKGPVLSFMDRGTVYDMGLYRDACRLASEQSIPYQSKAGVFGGNESRSLQVAGNGVRVAAVSVPCRYLHTPTCVVHKSDVEATGRLLSVLAESWGA